jgi:hypothetical protein
LGLDIDFGPLATHSRAATDFHNALWSVVPLGNVIVGWGPFVRVTPAHPRGSRPPREGARRRPRIPLLTHPAHKENRAASFSPFVAPRVDSFFPPVSCHQTELQLSAAGISPHPRHRRGRTGGSVVLAEPLGSSGCPRTRRTAAV